MIGLATGIQESAIGAFALLALGGIATGLLLSAVCFQPGKNARATRLTMMTRRLGAGLCVMFLVGACWSYYRAADARGAATKFHTVRSEEDGGIYTARYAYLTRDRILLRVYRTSDNTLLAERTYWYPDAARLIWTKDSLIYDTAVSGDDGLMRLPPSFIDRLLAKLP
ncbi:hypothetical protein [Burkholderia diffusa]|uniref:hypothetical protein n=1 Tax=Burkholderia diffusa TaxID=488732 RepID=UPI000ADF34FB|nr:hypothetical protein [Burkholderia diffusa]